MKMPEYTVNELALRKAVEMGIRRAGARSVRLRTAAIILCALMLTFGTVVAAQVYGTVDWRGRPIREEDSHVEPTIPPSAEDAAAEAAAEDWVDQWIESRPPTECWVAKYPNGIGRVGLPYEIIEDTSMLRERAGNSGLLTPDWVPDGYAPVYIQLDFYMTGETMVDVEKQPVEEGPYGLTLEKYRLSPAVFEHVAGYTLEYRDQENHRLLIDAVLSNPADSYSFGTQPDVAHGPVFVRGMREGFMYEYEDGRMYLSVLKDGLQPVSYLNAWPYDTYQPGTDQESKYTQAIYTVHTDVLTCEDVIKIAESLN